MEAAYSTGTLPGGSVPALAVSTAAGSFAVTAAGAAVAGVEVSTSAAEGSGYARAPPAGDFVLEEAARVLSDMIAPRPTASSRRKKEGRNLPEEKVL